MGRQKTKVEMGRKGGQGKEKKKGMEEEGERRG